MLDLAGNSFVDAVAEEVALCIQPDANSTDSASKADRTGFNIAKRIALIQADIWSHQDPSARIYELDEIPEQAQPNQDIINAGGHVRSCKKMAPSGTYQ